jgi:SAM-dependent methyltransferase
MDDPKVLERMRADWNQRAGEDANYYVAFGRHNQDEEEFFATGADVVRNLERELKRGPGRDAALEIGCGPGRLLRPMSRHFREVHGVDVSDEMIRLARERLRGAPNVFAHHNSGSDLRRFPDGKFDFVYSYAVFQHIPSRDVVFNYLREARRTLKTGGVLRCQLNGLPPHARQYDTWSGVRITADEITRFARENDFQLLALEQLWTQYMWITCRKQAPGWSAPVETRATVRNTSNSHTGEAVTPASGPLAALSLWIRELPAAFDLNHAAVLADGKPCRLIYVGAPAPDGVTQVNVALPEEIRTGLVPVEVSWLGRPLCRGWTRIAPAPPAAPRIEAVADGVNLLSGVRIVTRLVKATLSGVARAGDFRASVDGAAVLDWESFCTDPAAARYEFNFRLPAEVQSGPREVRIALGKRGFAPVGIEVA